MKKLSLILAMLFLAFSLSACGDNHEPPKDDATPPSDNNDTVYDDSLISEFYSMDGKYTDELGNDYSYSFHVPKIDKDSDGAKKVNDEIEKSVSPVVTEAKSNMDDKVSLTCYSVKWQSFWHGSTVNIVVTMENDWGSTDYRVFGYDFKDDKPVSSEDILKLANISEDDFLSKANDAIKSKFEELNGSAKDSSPDFYEQQLSWTLSSERINKDMMLYMDNNDKIVVVADIGSMAGADSYLHLVTID